MRNYRTPPQPIAAPLDAQVRELEARASRCNDLLFELYRQVRPGGEMLTPEAHACIVGEWIASRQAPAAPPPAQPGVEPAIRAAWDTERYKAPTND